MAQRHILKPPLPFVGNKFRWHRILRPIIDSLPQNAIIFDAFGGCLAVSRMAKDLRPDCVCICNDYGMIYRKRLDAVEDTNRILRRMWAAGAYNADRVYAKYDPCTERALSHIIAEAQDKTTIYTNYYVSGSGTATPRAKCRMSPYDVDACRRYTDGLVMIDEHLDAGKARYYAGACDLIIMDPPYTHGIRHRRCYHPDGTDDAQAFCRAVIDSGAAYLLWELPDAPIMDIAARRGAAITPYDGRRNPSCAREVLAVSPGVGMPRQAVPSIQAADPGYPRQLSLF